MMNKFTLSHHDSNWGLTWAQLGPIWECCLGVLLSKQAEFIQPVNGGISKKANLSSPLLSELRLV